MIEKKKQSSRQEESHGWHTPPDYAFPACILALAVIAGWILITRHWG